MKIKKHPGTGLWVREDGAVFIPDSGARKAHWTYGCKHKSTGYMRVQFRGKKYSVHRLIAETFIPNPNGYPTVDHFPDRNRSNNAASNLRWADRKMQNNNKHICEDSLARYGVRCCDDKREYNRAYYAENAKHYADKHRAYRETQKALGKRYRRCPDGKRKYLTDEEYNERYNKEEIKCVN